MSAGARVLVVHNRYRIEGGEERSVDLQLRALEAAGVGHATFERRSGEVGRARAARALLRGGEGAAELAAAVRALGGAEGGGDRPAGAKGGADRPERGGPGGGGDPAGGGGDRPEGGGAPVVVHAHNTLPLIGPAGLAAARAAGAAAVVLHLHNVRIFCATGFGERDGGPCRRCRGRNTLPGLVLNCRRSLPEAAAYAAALAAHQPRLLQAVDRFVAPSAVARDELAARGLPAERVEVLRHYLPADAFADRSRAADGAYALVASRLSPEKGIEDAVVACARAGVPLRIAGEGPERARLEALARDLGDGAPAAPSPSAAAAESSPSAPGAGPRATFLGRLSAAEVRRELAGAAMVLMPSRYHEFSPYSALEAMAQGVPVVATAMGGLPELLGGDRCTPPDAPAAFADRVAALWADPAARATAGDALLARARDRHSRDRHTRDLLALYDRVTA